MDSRKPEPPMATGVLSGPDRGLEAPGPGGGGKVPHQGTGVPPAQEVKHGLTQTGAATQTGPAKGDRALPGHDRGVEAQGPGGHGASPNQELRGPDAEALPAGRPSTGKDTSRGGLLRPTGRVLETDRPRGGRE